MSYTILAFFFLFLSLSEHANASSSVDSLYDCQNGTLGASQGYKNSTRAVLSDLVSHSLTNTFYASSSSAGGPNTTAYALFYCTANINSRACQTCVQKVVADAQLYCSSYKAAVVYYEDCTLRYNSTAVYATPEDYLAGWIYSTGLLSTVSYSGFNQTLYDTMNNLITAAAYGSDSKGFATGDAALVGTTQRLYALVQCTPDILGAPCKSCLDTALVLMPGCCYTDIWGSQKKLIMTFLPSCQLRYEVKFPETSSATPPYSPGRAVWYNVAVVAVAAFGLL